MSSVTRQPVPEPPAYLLWTSKSGVWFVEGPGGCCGGLFVDERSARRFIQSEHEKRSVGETQAAIMVVGRRAGATSRSEAEPDRSVRPARRHLRYGTVRLSLDIDARPPRVDR